MKSSVADWIESAKMDLENIRIIRDNSFLTPIAAFHAQQAVEKIFKAILEEYSGHVPKIHSVIKLYDMVSEFITIDVDYDILSDLDSVYIDARYPGDMGLMPNGKPEISDIADFLQFVDSLLAIAEKIK